MKSKNLLGLFLAVNTGVALLIILTVNAFFPNLILPRFDSTAIIIVALASLVLDCYISKDKRHSYILVPIFGLIAFGVFPFAALTVYPLEAVKLAILGAVIFTVITFLFDSITQRLNSGKKAIFAPVISAFCLFLASQCLMGII